MCAHKSAVRRDSCALELMKFHHMTENQTYLVQHEQSMRWLADGELRDRHKENSLVKVNFEFSFGISLKRKGVYGIDDNSIDIGIPYR